MNVSVLEYVSNQKDYEIKALLLYCVFYRKLETAIFNSNGNTTIMLSLWLEVVSIFFC
jgi:hypothetical protein